MDNMLVVAIMVVGLVMINPLISGSETKKIAATTQQTPSDNSSDDQSQDNDSDEDSDSEEEEEPDQQN